jgi:hypothetical protein
MTPRSGILQECQDIAPTHGKVIVKESVVALEMMLQEVARGLHVPIHAKDEEGHNSHLTQKPHTKTNNMLELNCNS